MRNLRLALAVTTGICALMAATAAAAPEPPEFGRCLKQATKALGNFDSAKCVKLASQDAGTEAEQLKKGNYQWFSGVVNNKFTINIASATYTVLETVGGTKITCSGATGSGEYAGTKEVKKVLVKFTGCESNKGQFESPGAGRGRVNTAALAGTLGFETITEDQPAKDHLALELHAEGGGNVAELESGSLKIVVRGSVLHRIAANAMKLTAREKFIQSRAKQKPEFFAGGVPGEHILESSTLGMPFEQTGFAMTQTLTNEEKVEASTVN